MPLSLNLKLGDGIYLIHPDRTIKIFLLNIDATTSSFKINKRNKSDNDQYLTVDYSHMFKIEELTETLVVPYKDGHSTSNQIKVSTYAPENVKIYHSKLEEKLNLSNAKYLNFNCY
jgi:hypothetical protein